MAPNNRLKLTAALREILRPRSLAWALDTHEMKILLTTILLIVILGHCIGCTTYHIKTETTKTQDSTKKPTICQLHALPLENVTVRIIYGFPILLEENEETRKKFPNAATPIYAGCFYSPSFKKYDQKAACPKCTELWMEWKKFHGV